MRVCLCAQFEVDGPPLCFCGLVPGSDVALEYMGDCGERCGMAWVQITGAYPASGIGVPDITPSNCRKAIGVDVQIGVARCMPVGNEQGEPPTEGQLREAVEQQVKDMMSVRAAILCCSAEDLIAGPVVPFGPEGGVYGHTVEVNFLVF